MILGIKKEGGVPAVNRVDLERIVVEIPPLEEQQRIVDILDRFDKLCMIFQRVYLLRLKQDKSKAFAVRIIKLYKYLCDEKKEFTLSKQLLRSGTSIGANVKEAVRGQSKPDFIAKMSIALKEASETEYWLELLYETEYLDKIQFDSIYADNQELIKILMSIVKSSNERRP